MEKNPKTTKQQTRRSMDEMHRKAAEERKARQEGQVTLPSAAYEDLKAHSATKEDALRDARRLHDELAAAQRQIVALEARLESALKIWLAARSERKDAEESLGCGYDVLASSADEDAEELLEELGDILGAKRCQA